MIESLDSNAHAEREIVADRKNADRQIAKQQRAVRVMVW
jgi:hypothetical protein